MVLRIQKLLFYLFGVLALAAVGFLLLQPAPGKSPNDPGMAKKLLVDPNLRLDPYIPGGRAEIAEKTEPYIYVPTSTAPSFYEGQRFTYSLPHLDVSTTTAHLLRYTNDDFGIRFLYPNDWIVDNSPDFFSLNDESKFRNPHPFSPAIGMITKTRYADPRFPYDANLYTISYIDSPARDLDSLFQLIGYAASDDVERGFAEQVGFKGLPAFQILWYGSHGPSLFVQHGNRYYLIQKNDPYRSAVYELMLNTLEFTR